MIGPYIGVIVVSLWSLLTKGVDSASGQFDAACFLMSLTRIVEIGVGHIANRLEASR